MRNVTAKDVAEACGGKIISGNPDTVLAHISIDSRKMQGDDLFVPIIGEVPKNEDGFDVKPLPFSIIRFPTLYSGIKYTPIMQLGSSTKR